jgi:hypothetical protein
MEKRWTVRRIDELFAIEREINGLPEEQRLAVRQFANSLTSEDTCYGKQGTARQSREAQAEERETQTRAANFLRVRRDDEEHCWAEVVRDLAIVIQSGAVIHFGLRLSNAARILS